MEAPRFDGFYLNVESLQRVQPHIQHMLTQQLRFLVKVVAETVRDEEGDEREVYSEVWVPLGPWPVPPGQCQREIWALRAARGRESAHLRPAGIALPGEQPQTSCGSVDFEASTGASSADEQHPCARRFAPRRRLLHRSPRVSASRAARHLDPEESGPRLLRALHPCTSRRRGQLEPRRAQGGCKGPCGSFLRRARSARTRRCSEGRAQDGRCWFGFLHAPSRPRLLSGR